MTFDDIETEWKSNMTQGERRELWEKLTDPVTRGWFYACRQAVATREAQSLKAWLNQEDRVKQEIIGFRKEAANLMRAHLLCALAACEHVHWPSGTVPDESLLPVAHQTMLALGFLRDVSQELLCGQPRPSPQNQNEKQPLTALLVDEYRNNGVAATLTLERMPDGSGALYPVPALAFLPDEEFRQAGERAREYIRNEGLWKEGWDVRWRLKRCDGQPIIALTGSSMGGAFALGLGKLLVMD